MTTYYVSTSGSDSSSGTSKSSPFKTLNHAFGKLYPGDTLYLLDGTWNERWSHGDNTFPRSGSSGKPITIKGYGNNAVMRKDDHGIGLNFENRSYFNIENIEIFHYSQGIYCEESHHINIINCNIHYMGCTTVTIEDSHDFLIQSTNMSDTGHNTVQFSAKNREVYNIKIDNCTIHGSPGSTHFGDYHNLIDFFNNHDGSSTTIQIRDCTISNCKIYDTKDNAIFTHARKVKHMDDCIISNNEIYDTNRAIISLFRGLIYEHNNMHDNKLDGFRTLYPEKLIGPAHILFNRVRSSNHDTRMVCTGSNILFEYEDYGLLHIEDGTVTFKNPINDKLTINTNWSGKVIFQLTDGRSFTYSGKGTKTNISGGTQYTSAKGDIATINISGSSPPPTSSPPPPTPTPTITPSPTPTPTTGSIKVTCNVVANITLNDANPQTTPYTYHNVPTGYNAVKFRKTDYNSEDRWVLIKGGDVQDVHIDMIYNPITTFPINFNSNPSGAKIYEV